MNTLILNQSHLIYFLKYPYILQYLRLQNDDYIE